MRARRGRNVVVGVFLLVAAIGAAWLVNLGRHAVTPAPGCSIANADGDSDAYRLTLSQARNASTIAAVGMRLGMPNHAVTVALATAMQESKLINLAGGDRDSAGLFQQRPSQGWGSYDQVHDPVYASETFYKHLGTLPDWQQMPVNDAAQLVQRSGAPTAYAKWEDEARTVAMAMTGELPGAVSCHGVSRTVPTDDLADRALDELGTSAVTGPHDASQGWALSAWLVSHADDLGIDEVSFAGRQWTASSGKWTDHAPADSVLTLHRVAGEA